MKKRIITLGIIAITILTTIVLASNIEQLTAYIAQLRIFVDGEERSFENPIVTINDRTYVPLREVSEVLGMSVDWDGDNQKIIINSTPKLYDEWGIVLHPFRQDGLWGYRDVLGNVIIEPQYIDVDGFSEGFASVIARRWDRANNEDYLIDGTSGPFIFIDRTGRNVFEQEFVYAYPFEDGLANVFLFNGNYAFIDRTGQNAFEKEFRRAERFRDGYARVTLLDGTRTIIDRSGNIVDR